MDEGQASFLLNDFTVEDFIYLPLKLSGWFSPTTLLAVHKFDSLAKEKQGGKTSLPKPQPVVRKVIRLFTSFIDLMVFAFHNFLALERPFCSLESITWRECKNLLLIHWNVAKMLVVKAESACSLTLVPGKAHLFSQVYPGKIQ